MAELSRRHFLTRSSAAACTLAGGALGAVGLGFVVPHRTVDAQSRLVVGNLDGVEPGTRLFFPAASLVVWATTRGFAAISTTCTHLGCRVEARDEGFVCPCHGSEFTEQGRTHLGPREEAARMVRNRGPRRRRRLHRPSRSVGSGRHLLSALVKSTRQTRRKKSRE